MTPHVVRSKRPRRGGWVVLFMVAGLVAAFSAMVLPFSLGTAFPFVAVSWPLAGLAAYRIWRVDHPSDSARSAVGLRLEWLRRGLATGIGFVIVSAFLSLPWYWIVVIVGIFLAVLFAYAVVLWRLELPSQAPTNSEDGEP